MFLIDVLLDKDNNEKREECYISNSYSSISFCNI